MDLFTRTVKEEDLETCVKLVSQPELINFQGHYVGKEWLHSLSEDGLSIVIETRDKEIIGCLFAERLKMNGCLLWLISIDEKHRNKKFGTMLLKHFEDNCREIHNIEWIILYSTTKSLYNRYFYMKNGYENESGSFFEFGKEL